jgi:hypothetical protein
MRNIQLLPLTWKSRSRQKKKLAAGATPTKTRHIANRLHTEQDKIIGIPGAGDTNSAGRANPRGASLDGSSPDIETQVSDPMA